MFKKKKHSPNRRDENVSFSKYYLCNYLKLLLVNDQDLLNENLVLLFGIKSILFWNYHLLYREILLPRFLDKK